MDQNTKAVMSSFMSDFWKYEKTFWLPDGSDSYWDQLIEEGRAIAGKYETSDVGEYIQLLLGDFIQSRQDFSTEKGGKDGKSF